jgi:hypothetical protein
MAPTLKVQQLITVHLGMSALLNFESNQTMGDYHKEMNSSNYMQCVQKKLILNLPHKYVFIIDNATYHYVLSEKCLTSSSKKEDTENLLLKNKIPLSGDLLKAELNALIKLHKRRTRGMILMTYRVLMDTQFSIYHHSSLSLTTSGVMSSSGLESRMSCTSWVMWANCEQWFAEISDTDWGAI